MQASLLVELLTEELPPKSLARLSQTFCEVLSANLEQEGFLTRHSAARAFATPRRLAVSITGVLDKAADQALEITGPSANAPPQAVTGFAKKHGVAVDELAQLDTPKGRVFACRKLVQGAQLDAILALKVEDALKRLPVAKTMRWGDGEAQFVRPVHGLVMMHGARAVPGTVLGVPASSTTHGHRFMALGPIALENADEYEARLRDDGMVIADFATRRAQIEHQLRSEAKRTGAELGEFAGLLEEVTALVEHPSVYVGAFDAGFLEVPQECLILTMRQNQKYFPLFDASGRLLPKFLIVSNMRVADPRRIIDGNQRVVRPRLEDARFFFNQDRKRRLESRVPELAKVVYHGKLGSQLERTERLQLLAGRVARALGADAMAAERAAWLSKADLLTGMVGEFPELQGVMGRYYALHDGEAAEVADAIEAHYLPRFAGDRVPQAPISCAVALADKLCSLAGFFGIGEQPTGEKDPYGLRRAALGVIRIVVENRLALALNGLVSDAFAVFDGQIGDAHAELETFIFERFAGYLKDRGFSTLQVDAVLSQRPVRIGLVPRQLEAVKAFEALPQAESLAAANKRVANILRQAATKGESYAKADRAALQEPAEVELFDALQKASSAAEKLFEQGDYTGYLKTFAVLKAPVDAFFDKVMVMVEQDALRRNRLALLADLRQAMNRVADISRLAA
ncbi:MAG TPA: glycine--tRNA ligase subunit beta [Burkholderiales bacterium]|nr:glycine--tRNA ligase subunit beta [Burkholderiales bacterium]